MSEEFYINELKIEHIRMEENLKRIEDIREALNKLTFNIYCTKINLETELKLRGALENEETEIIEAE